jgi:hypothetical protein
MLCANKFIIKITRLYYYTLLKVRNILWMAHVVNYIEFSKS